jgi:DNA-binding MarR family transcriptional regulator
VSADDALSALEEELAALFRRARSTARDAARDLDPRLDATLYPLVVVLLRTGPIRMSDLAGELMLDKSTLSRQVDAAVRTGLVERVVDPSDARARLVRLTETGRERLSRQRAERLGRWRGALAGWDRADVVRLTELLHRMGESGVS